MAKPRKGFPRGSDVDNAVVDEFESRGDGEVHFRNDLVLGRDFYEGMAGRLILTPAQYNSCDSLGRLRRTQEVYLSCQRLAKSGHLVHVRLNVWKRTEKPWLPKGGTRPRPSPPRPIDDVSGLSWVRL